MAVFNAAVDLEGRKIDDVARTFLRSRRLLEQGRVTAAAEWVPSRRF